MAFSQLQLDYIENLFVNHRRSYWRKQAGEPLVVVNYPNLDRRALPALIKAGVVVDERSGNTLTPAGEELGAQLFGDNTDEMFAQAWADFLTSRDYGLTVLEHLDKWNIRFHSVNGGDVTVSIYWRGLGTILVSTSTINHTVRPASVIGLGRANLADWGAALEMADWAHGVLCEFRFNS